MPTYDYKCKTCEKVFEHFQSMKEESLKECLCGKKGSVTRMISAGSGIIFKGSGFYVTDYKKTSSPETTTTTPVPATPVTTPVATPTVVPSSPVKS